MDLKKYDELRKKIHKKDFEGNNKSLDNWLYKLSFLGNVGSIFFAYFLVNPALHKAISVNLISGNWGFVLALIITIAILVSFEAIKRLLIKNFSFNAVKNKFKVKQGKLLSWFAFSIAIVSLSFYLSLNGARNFASTSLQKNEVAQTDLQSQVDSLTNQYDNQKSIYLIDNQNLREVTNDLREKLAETPVTYRTIRNEYQASIDKNTEVINNNQERIDQLDEELQLVVAELRQTYVSTTDQNKRDDVRNIWLFILISTSIEVLIIVGVYFREFYEYNLFIANEDRLEKVYKKRDRYRAMLEYVYREGKAQPGERIMGAQKLIDLVSENSTISQPKTFVENFLRDMENLDIFVVEGKRRNLNATYQEALNVIENFDDALRILKNLK
jgi:hypothetical protein